MNYTQLVDEIDRKHQKPLAPTALSLSLVNSRSMPTDKPECGAPLLPRSTVSASDFARAIAHVDMDAFFAAVEEQRHPELRGTPLVIGGRGESTERGVVSTATCAARSYGVRSGMPLRVAYRRCQDAVFLPVDHEDYTAVSHRIMEILHSIAPTVEQSGIDEAYLDLTGMPEDPPMIVRAVKQRILAAIGLTCSVGIAPKKLLAELASDILKTDSLTLLT